MIETTMDDSSDGYMYRHLRVHLRVQLTCTQGTRQQKLALKYEGF